MACYVGSAIFLAALALTTGDGPWVLTFSFLAGFTGVGVQIAVTYMIANAVSAQLRVAVLSVAMVFSRSGGAAGPLAVGILAQAGYSPGSVFFCIAALPVLTAIGTLAFGTAQRRRLHGPNV